MNLSGKKSRVKGEGNRRRRGSVVILMSVLMVVVMTTMVSTSALVGGVGSEVSSMTFHRDQAFYAAEAGIQRAYYEVEYGAWMNPLWSNGHPTYPSYTVVMGNCSYAVTASGGGFNTPVVVTSTGTYNANSQIKSVITVTMQPKSTIPAIQLGSSISEAGNITVDGNTLVKGNIHLGGKVSIAGVLQYGGTQNDVSFATYNPNIPAPPDVWYDATNTLTAPSGAISVNDLISSSGAHRFTDTTPSSLDFTNHDVLYIIVPSGQTLTLKNMNVYGSGTLVVIGNVSVQNGLGDQTDGVNIVATGNVSTQGNFRVFGSIYAGGDIAHQGQFQVTGVISAEGNMYPTQSNNGAGGATIVRAPPPGFDPRGASGSGSILIQNFTGQPTLQ